MIMKPSSIVAFALCAGLCAQRLSADDQPVTAPSSPEKSTPTAPHDSSPKKKKASAPQKSSGDTEPLKATPLTLGPAIVTQKGVNVRAQAAINSEVVVRLKKGDHVNVIEEVTLKKPKTDEPAK